MKIIRWLWPIYNVVLIVAMAIVGDSRYAYYVEMEKMNPLSMTVPRLAAFLDVAWLLIPLLIGNVLFFILWKKHR